MKNSSDNVGNRTLDLPACSIVPELGSKLQSKIPYIHFFLFLSRFFLQPVFQFKIYHFLIGAIPLCYINTVNTKYITISQNTTKIIVLCCTICFTTTCFGPFL